MAKIIFLKGLPGSGKTTFAKEYIKKHPNTKRINKDDLRAMLDESVWSPNNESNVLKVQKAIVVECLFNGYDVILDNTHLNPKHEESYRELCEKTDYEFEVKFFDVPVEECIQRDKQRTKPVGAKVIKDMYFKYLYKPVERVPYNPKLPDCIICDIDGTLAESTGRSPYDYTKVHLDRIVEPVRDIVNMHRSDCVFILSGREDSCKDETEKWLRDNFVMYNTLFMRQTGDRRADNIIKKEIYDAHIKGRYNVKFVIDDRKRVKRMWVNEGLFVLDVNQTDAEF